MGTVRTRSGLLQDYLGKRTQMPSSSPAPFSCYEMQRRLNENLQVCPIFCLITGVHPRTWVQLGSKYEPLNAFNCATLFFRYRVQINLARNLRCGVPQQCLHGSYWSAYAIKHRRVAVPQKMPSDHGSRDKSIPVS